MLESEINQTEKQTFVEKSEIACFDENANTSNIDSHQRNANLSIADIRKWAKNNVKERITKDVRYQE